ncbi:rhamnan synthesis F family protein, partial [Pseudogemmobacter blasticus]
PGRLEALATRARRISEALIAENNPLGAKFTRQECDWWIERVIRNEPLWASGPAAFNRDRGKVCLPLWPRRQTPAASSRPGVFLHLYYSDLAPVFAKRLAHISCPFDLYVSTDTAEKADFIRGCLPAAEIRVLENRGRDVWPKLYGFRDVYARHDIVLHLHGKKSPHSAALDEWLEHILDCLVGSADEVNRILSLFDTIPRLGMVKPVTFKAALSAAHWGANREIARELAWRMKIEAPLPDDGKLRFPAGSMFWARRDAIQPLLDLDLRPEHFPPEAGQVDGTVAHAIERMLGVVCKVNGHHILPVSGAGTRLHMMYQKRFTSNGELRAALEAGVFDA